MSHVTDALILAAVAAAGYVAYRAYKSGGNIAQAATQAVQQAAANVGSAWTNNVASPYEQGRLWATTGAEPYKGEKAWLYSDYGYTGNDINGDPIIGGEWYGNADARRYDIAQAENGRPPAATSINGAAFGVYPSSGINRAAADDKRQIDRIMERLYVQPEGSW